MKYIEIKGARVNNLKNVTVKIPLNSFTVITGLSGSGKSSLAFDTLYAEGQRRYVESLSAYARQFLGKEPMDITSRDGRNAVRDLLMGNAVEKMIQQENNNTQQIMGDGLWNLKNLRFFTANTATRRGIQSEDIQALLEKPNSTKAFGIGKNTVNEIVQASMEVYDDVEKAAQKEMELTNQEEQPQINPLTMPG